MYLKISQTDIKTCNSNPNSNYRFWSNPNSKSIFSMQSSQKTAIVIKVEKTSKKSFYAIFSKDLAKESNLSRVPPLYLVEQIFWHRFGSEQKGHLRGFKSRISLQMHCVQLGYIGAISAWQERHLFDEQSREPSPVSKQVSRSIQSPPVGFRLVWS